MSSERAGIHGAAVDPLAGVRAPQRVSAPPSSGLAVAPFWPRSSSPTPAKGRLGSSSPAPAKGRFGWVSSHFPFSFPYFFFIWFFSHPN